MKALIVVRFRQARRIIIMQREGIIKYADLGRFCISRQTHRTILLFVLRPDYDGSYARIPRITPYKTYCNNHLPKTLHYHALTTSSIDQGRIVRVAFRTAHVEGGHVRLVKRRIPPEALWQVRIGQEWHSEGDKVGLAAGNRFVPAVEVIATVQYERPFKNSAQGRPKPCLGWHELRLPPMGSIK